MHHLLSTYCLLGTMKGIRPVKNPVVENPSIYLGTSVWPIQTSVMLDVCDDDSFVTCRQIVIFS